MTKFSVRIAIDGDERLDRMRENIRRDVPRLTLQPVRDGVLAVCGYGPSLKDTWREISTPYVLTTSGAHNFLISRKIIPSWHVEFDPRPHKAKFLEHPCRQTTYCIASVCHPLMFEQLAKSKVLLWHALGGNRDADCEVVNEAEDDGILLTGGSTAGLRALAVGHVLGFRKFALFGMDCSYRDGETWAGGHPSGSHKSFRVNCNGKEFLTSDVMINAADELFGYITAVMADCEFVIHGEHMFAERVKLAKIKDIVSGWWRPVGFRSKVLIDGVAQSDELLSDDYRATLRWLHQIDPKYGSGAEHANQVSILMRAVGTEDVLDYGCGKGALAKKLGVPIKQYDPGIDDVLPEPADIVVCANVLQEVEDKSLNAVIEHVAKLTKRVAFFEVATRPSAEWIAERVAAHGAMDNKWWAEVIEYHFDFVGPPFGNKTRLRAICVPKIGG